MYQASDTTKYFTDCFRKAHLKLIKIHPFSPLLGLVCFACYSFIHNGVEYQTNDIRFSTTKGSEATLRGVRFWIDDYLITAGQDPDTHIDLETKVEATGAFAFYLTQQIPRKSQTGGSDHFSASGAPSTEPRTSSTAHSKVVWLHLRQRPSV
jgi:hypothetical protein